MARCRPSRALALGFLLLLSPFLALAPTAAAAEASEDGKLPIRVVGASAVAWEGSSYVLGGRKDDGTYSDAIYKFDHATSAVTTVGNLPRIGTDQGGRQSGAAAVLNDRIYYFGGAALVNAGDLNNDGNPNYVPRAISDIVRVDPRTGEASKIVPTLPAGVFGLSAVTVGTKVFLFGGFSFDVTRPDQIDRKDWILEFDGSSVRTVGRLPYAVQDAAVVNLGGTVYLFGGLSDHEPTYNACPTYRYYNETSGQNEDVQPTACLTDAILQFRPASGVSSVYGKLPYRAQFLHAGVVEGRAYIPGAALSGPTATSSIVEFDPSAMEPVRVLTPTLPRAAYSAPVTVVDGNLTIFGGRTGGYAELTDAITRFNPRATAPWAPRGLEVAVGTSSVTLSWQPPAYDGGSPVTSYRVYRTGDNGVEERVAEVSGGAVRHVDSTIAPGATYTYRVTSVNVAGESARDARASTRSAETVPGAVDAFEAFPGDREVLLTWLPPLHTGGLNLSGYRVYRDGTLLRTVTASTTRLLDTDVQNEVAYTYSVRAYNGKGDGPASPDVRVTPIPVPKPPEQPRAEVVPGNTVRLTWAEPVTGGVSGYTILRGTEPKYLSRVAENLTSRDFVDSGVEAGRTYYYAVVSVNSRGESPPTELATVSLVTPPSAPVNLLVSPGQGEVRLTWQTPDDTGGADPRSLTYQVLRGDANGNNLRIIATDVRGATYVDRFVVPGTTYSYALAAMNPLLGTQSAAKTGTPRAVVNELPEAVLAALPPVAKAGETIEFDASQSADLDGSIAEYRFDFGDGTTDRGTSSSASHSYAVNGTYYATLVVVDNRGGESPAAMVQVVVGQIDAPLSGEENGGGVIPGAKTPSTAARPGTSNPTPGVGFAVALGALAAVAVALRRRG